MLECVQCAAVEESLQSDQTCKELAESFPVGVPSAGLPTGDCGTCSSSVSPNATVLQSADNAEVEHGSTVDKSDSSQESQASKDLLVHSSVSVDPTSTSCQSGSDRSIFTDNSLSTALQANSDLVAGVYEGKGQMLCSYKIIGQHIA